MSQCFTSGPRSGRRDHRHEGHAVECLIGIPTLAGRPSPTEPPQSPGTTDVANKSRGGRRARWEHLHPDPAPQGRVEANQEHADVRRAQRSDDVVRTDALGRGRVGSRIQRGVENRSGRFRGAFDDTRAADELVDAGESVAPARGRKQKTVEHPDQEPRHRTPPIQASGLDRGACTAGSPGTTASETGALGRALVPDQDADRRVLSPKTTTRLPIDALQ